MWGYFCIGFIGFILAGKDLTDLPIFCHQITSKKKKKKNDDDIILNYFMTNV